MVLGPTLARHADVVCTYATALDRDGGLSTSSPLCGAPAVAHVMVNDAGDNVLTCARHARVVDEVFTVLDAHRAATLCVLPGSVWGVAERRCLVPGLDDEGLELRAALTLEEASH